MTTLSTGLLVLTTILPFLARLDEVQEELLYYPRRRRKQNVKSFYVKVFYVMGKHYPVPVTGLVIFIL